MADWIIERLDKGRHQRDAFDCGKPTLTRWIREQATQFEKRGLAVTYVATRPGDPAVVGYHAIATHHVRVETLPGRQAKGLPARLDVPTVLLGRLAVDRSVQGRGLGKSLLIDALGRALALSRRVGIRLVEVDAIDDKARAFYGSFGFEPLEDGPLHLYLPVASIEGLGLDPIDD